MVLQRLELKKFRNYSRLELSLSPGVNLFYGRNGQGKTNLLEAVSLLSLGRSFRTKRENEFIQWDAETCYLKGFFQHDDTARIVEIGFGQNQKKVKVNHQELKIADLFSQVAVVSFAPDDLQLVKGAPQLRRDFIDFYLAQIEPEYRGVYYDFYKVLHHRNRFLKDVKYNYDSVEFDVWNEQLVATGAKVIKYRAALIEKMKPYITAAHQKIGLNQEPLQMKYISLGQTDMEQRSEAEIGEIYLTDLKAIRSLELQRRLSLSGPQRDELRLTFDRDLEIRNYGSQGQQRTVALALKLGMIDILTASRGVPPILLLDDVMSEFDNERKHALLTMLLGSTQTFVTSTGKNDFPITKSADTLFYQIDQGVVDDGG